MTTVITVEGLSAGKDVTGPALGGYANRHRRIRSDREVATSTAGFARRVDNFDKAIRNAIKDGPVELVGHSQGCEVIGDWLRRHADKPDAPTTDQIVRIVLLGDPGRQYGGRMGFRFGGQRRQPTPVTQYRTDSVARLGDEFANFDGWGTVKRSPLASLLARFLGIDNEAHRDYSSVDLNKCEVRAREGQTTYWVAP